MLERAGHHLDELKGADGAYGKTSRNIVIQEREPSSGDTLWRAGIMDEPQFELGARDGRSGP